MKLEKREITLNEYDSLKDVFFLHKSLLQHGLDGMENISKKETETAFFAWWKETGEDLLFVQDLMNGSAVCKGNASK